MTDRLGNALTAIAVVCAVTMTGLAVKREIAASPAATGTMPVKVKNWQELISGGHRLGESSAPITIVELVDFECPYCSTFANVTLPRIVTQYAGRVSFIFRHFPLNGHANAYPAARAAECAGAQGRFNEFAALLFSKQDSLGQKSYRSFASDAGIADLKTFDACSARATPVPAIERDKALSIAAGANGTPTIIINGYRIPKPLSAAIDSLIKRELSRSSASR